MDKKKIKQIQKTLKKNNLVFDQLNKKQTEDAFKFCEEYKKFLNQSKTERETVSQVIKTVKNKGFIDIETLIEKSSKQTLKNIKVYKSFQNRSIALAVIGTNDLIKGANIVASHIDSPRLDLKQNPFYEDLSMTLLKTHYYGGIRKYHWLAIPLALHGTIVTSENKKIDIIIGEDTEDPVFTITDLLPHLAGKIQSSKKISEVFEGEKLNLISGSIPLGNKEEKERFKLGILNLLNEKYGLVEEDFTSADIEVVPSQKAKDVGFDRSIIGAYGQDDKVCTYSGLQAIFANRAPKRTSIALFFDKEEIGSEGSSGANSNFLEDFMSDLLLISKNKTDNRTLRKALINSSCLSADVNAAMDPDYKDVHEPLNAARLGFGICITKFTGVRGKAGASEASAEFVGKIRQIFNNNKIVWQTGEIGKIDMGGGGTIAKFLAEYGMDVLDCGPALLSMHSVFELSSKADVYMTYLGYKAFYSDNV